MCGLTGFARNAKDPAATPEGLIMAKLIFEELMVRAQSRGKHATGVAITNSHGETSIHKLAMPATEMLKLKLWDEKVMGADDVVIMQGHTRRATQNNAHVDACAHPFRFGDVTGAHNGMIYNWRELNREEKNTAAWSVDSEAVFDLLSREKDPQKVLNKLDGYWALTWVKNLSIYFVKTQDAVLASAYVPSLRTLFWHSEFQVLESVLQEALKGNSKGVPQKLDIWSLAPGRLYTVNPFKMNAESPMAKKRDVTFKGRRDTKYDTWRTNGPVRGGYSTQRRLKAGEVGSYDNYSANNQTLGQQMSQLSLGLSAEERTMWAAIRELENRVNDLESAKEVLEQEVEFLRTICDDAGLLEIEEQGPYSDATDKDICVECGEPGATLDDTDGKIHPECILAGRQPRPRQAGVA